MMEHHATVRFAERQLMTGVAALEVGCWPEGLSAAAGTILHLLPGHIQKEDNILFSMTDDLLSESEWDEPRLLWRFTETVPL
jgi:hemerythrin-like domain-containing protein